MRRSIVNDLKLKIFHSGNSLHLFIAINVALFLLIGLSMVIESLFLQKGVLSIPIQNQLMMPASLDRLLYKPWTILTYMFTHAGLFHVLFNMLWLYWLGQIFLDFLNNRQFIFTYIAGGIAGAVVCLIVYAVHPTFNIVSTASALLGASASVSAVILATATLVPDYSIRLLFFGNVKLKYLALAFVLLSILGIGGSNAGGNFSHLGGALLGFLFIRRLRKGRDWSKLFSKQKRKTKFKVYKNESVKSTDIPNQDYIDTLLDKISQSGYKSLSKSEKDALFKASERDPK